MRIDRRGRLELGIGVVAPRAPVVLGPRRGAADRAARIEHRGVVRLEHHGLGIERREADQIDLAALDADARLARCGDADAIGRAAGEHHAARRVHAERAFARGARGHREPRQP
jgi:hypothetical protein